MTGDWKDWFNFALDNPAPIEYSIKLISDLFISSLFKNSTLEQLSLMRSNFLTGISDYCKQIGCTTVPSSDPTLPYGMTILFSISEAYGVIMNGGTVVSNLNELKVNLKPFYMVKKVLIRCDQYIRSVQFLLSDQKTTYFTKIIGAETKTTPQEWLVPNDEYIVQIEIFIGTYVDSLRFFTNKGSMSQKFGGIGGSYNQINLRGQLVGAQASYPPGANLLQRLSFITSTVQYYDSREALCLPGWVFNSGSCYFKPQMQLNFTESRKYCESINSNTSLIVINSDNELDFFYTSFLDNYSEFWVMSNQTINFSIYLTGSFILQFFIFKNK